MNQTLNDPTEDARRALVPIINSLAAERAQLENRHGPVWSTSELTDEFEVIRFAAPFAVVKRKADNQLGSVVFQHRPRYYFSFHADS